YVLVNLGYLAALGHAGLARSEAPAAAVMRQAFGPLGERLIAAGIAVSTFGYCAVALGGAARVLQTIAAQGLFFRSLGVLHPRRRTPQRALIVLAGWSIVLALSGSFAWLLNYTTVVDWLGYAATIAALFWY
ncbi:amino acid transporter, partial [mine drainage metagenome]